MTSRRVLVIDDDQAVRYTLETVLTAAGYEVMPAENGLCGMRLYRQAKPDLVITDIVMPDQEGLETIMEIRKVDPDAKIIAISGGGRYGGGHFLELATALGASAALAKPFDLDLLLSTVEYWLAKATGDEGPRATAC